MWKGWSARNSDEIDTDASSGVQFEIASGSDVFETGRKEWLPENLQLEVAAIERDRWPEEPARSAQRGDSQD